MIRFVQSGGQRFRVLLDDESGMWLINFDEPAAPFRVCAERTLIERIETPTIFLKYFNREVTDYSEAERSRFDLITPLLKNAECIRKKELRLALSDEIARKINTTRRRVLRIYYKYLATGILTERKQKESRRNPVFDWAIETFYFSAKRLSLYAAYEMMLLKKFTTENGTLIDNFPSWYSFQHYYYRNRYHRNPGKIISREGRSYYSRNYRPLRGSEDTWKTKVGAFQLDATQADIYLVSSLDREQVVGRPYIYLSVDTASHLITGFYVGFRAGECSVMECLAQSAEDKVTYCSRHGIEIEADQWPSSSVPSQVITDRGRDFCGKRMQEFCMRYGVEMEALPPFRPDEKGLVEKSFDLLQRLYKPLLRGCGVIEDNAQERWSVDYRDQAILDLEEFRQIIIYCIINLNSGRILKDGKTPAQRWSTLEHALLRADISDLYKMSFDRKSVKLSRKGFYFRSFWYIPKVKSLPIGERYTLAFSTSDISRVFVVTDEQWIECQAIFLDADRELITDAEAEIHQKVFREQKKKLNRESIEKDILTYGNIERIIKKVKSDGEKTHEI